MFSPNALKRQLSWKLGRRATMGRAVCRGLESLECRRLLSAGQLDATFGNAGVVEDNTHPGASVLQVLANGKIIEAGQTYYNGAPAISLARFNSNGSQDTSFGYFGQVTRPLSGTVPLIFDVHGPKVETDGKITLITSENGNFTVIRYNADGQLDSTFGNNGVATTDFGGTEHATAIAIAPNGRIIVAGDTLASAALPAGQVDVAAYLSNGQLDPSFGVGGKLVIPPTTDRVTLVHDLAIQSDGKIILAGENSDPSFNGQSSPFITRLNSNGSPDGTVFDSSLNNLSSLAYEATTLQSDGKILVTKFDPSTYDPGPAIIRFNASGTLDQTFGTNGTVQDTLTTSELADIFVQPDHKIVAAGYFSDPNGPGDNSAHFLTERFNADGSRDNTFGTGGRVITVLGGNNLAAHRAAPAPDGSIVEVGGIVELAMIRYTGDGIPTGGNGGGSISGTVYNDANGNGRFDAGEAPVAGRQVYLDLNGIGVFATGDPIATTDVSGHYAFLNLPVTNYIVRLKPQNGLAITSPVWGGKYFNQLSLTPNVTGDDFGTIAISSPSYPLPNGQLLAYGFSNGYTTFTRYNADGSTDATFGRLGLVIVGDTNNAPPSSVTADSIGQYTIVLPDSTVRLSPYGSILSITSNAGASISGIVYNDANSNHVRDAGESAVVGRQVYLDLTGLGSYVAGDPLASTDGNGAYFFGGLSAGNYLVRLFPQIYTVTTTPIYGAKYFVQLAANQQVHGDDFGTLSFGVSSQPPYLYLQDGKVLISSRQARFMLTRYNVDGSVDTTYGQNGVTDTGVSVGSVGGGITDMWSRPDGDVLIRFNLPSQYSSVSDLLQLLDPNGVPLHQVFINTQFQGQQGTDTIEKILVTRDNKVLVIGQHDDPSPNHYQFVRRYNADLSLDLTFGQQGSTSFDPSALITDQGKLIDITELADGRTILRYTNDTVLLTTTGMVDTASPVLFQPDATWLIGGQTNGFASISRYLYGGAPDTGLFNNGTYTTSFPGQTYRIIVEPSGAIVLWEKSSSNSGLTDGLDFLTSYGFGKGHNNIASSVGGNSGSTVQKVNNVFYNGSGIEVDGTSTQTTYSYSSLPNTVVVTPFTAVYYVGYTNL